MVTGLVDEKVPNSNHLKSEGLRHATWDKPQRPTKEPDKFFFPF